MLTRVLGYFDTSESAKKAKKLLHENDFAPSAVTLQSYKDKGAANVNHYVESLAHGQTLVVVEVSGNVDEDRAINILRQTNAVKINEIETRFRPLAAAE